MLFADGLVLIAASATVLVLTVSLTVVTGDCRFPSSWTGTWFQSGIRHPIKVEGNFMTSKGTCLESKGDKFVMEDRHERCYRCVVINQKHDSVLQYKETFCDSWDSLENLCSGINGDAQLHSMFRVNASPIPCPIRGPLTFTYNRGREDCHNPLSAVDSCSDDSRLLFRYQACPDIDGSESTVEELACLADWKEGSTRRYLVGRLEHNLATTDEDRFRCFMFSKTKQMYYMSQSDDATCSGLLSPIEGPKIMKFYRASYPPSECQFPWWAVHAHRWHRLDNAETYVFSRRNNHSFAVHDETKTAMAAVTSAATSSATHLAQVRCLEEAQGRASTFKTHVIMGCASGYMCMSFVRRGSHVMEVQKGNMSRSMDDACDVPFFDRSKSEYTTLVTSSPERIRCPNKGQYAAPPIVAQLTASTVQSFMHGTGSVISAASVTAFGADRSPRHPQHEDGVASGTGSGVEHDQQRASTCSESLTVRVGCARDGDVMEFQDDCIPEPKTEAFHCHGAWDENGTSYLIASLKGTKVRYCFVYAEVDNTVKLTSVQKSCKRHLQPDVGGTFYFNVTSQGQCDPDYSSATSATEALHCPAATTTAVTISTVVMQLVSIFVRFTAALGGRHAAER